MQIFKPLAVPEVCWKMIRNSSVVLRKLCDFLLDIHCKRYLEQL